MTVKLSTSGKSTLNAPNSKSVTNSILRQALSTQTKMKMKPNSSGVFGKCRIIQKNRAFRLAKLSESSTYTPVRSTFMPIKNYKKVNMTWRSKNASEDNYLEDNLVSDDGKLVYFHSECSGCWQTTGIRATQPLKRNVFTYWQCSMPVRSISPEVTSVQVGLGRSDTQLTCEGYLNLLGMDEMSWALDHKGHTWHDNCSKPFSEPFSSSDDKDEICTIGCLFDGFTGRLAYYKNGVPLGTAFHRLPIGNNKDDKDYQYTDLYPMVSSTVARSWVRLECAYESFPTLKDLCRAQIIRDSQTAQIPYQIL